MMKTNLGVTIGKRTHLLKNVAQTQYSKRRYSKRFNCYYIAQKVLYKGMPLKIFLVRMKGQQTWRALVSTDLTLSFTKAMEIYAIRWTIEVSFKDMKQHLGLGKHQSIDFDAQIAATTITCLQYIILAFAKRHEDYESIGGMFEVLKQSILQVHLLERIIHLLETVYAEIVAPFVVVFDEFMHTLLSTDKIARRLESALQIVASSKIQPHPPNFKY